MKSRQLLSPIQIQTSNFNILDRSEKQINAMNLPHSNSLLSKIYNKQKTLEFDKNSRWLDVACGKEHSFFVLFLKKKKI